MITSIGTGSGPISSLRFVRSQLFPRLHQPDSPAPSLAVLQVASLNNCTDSGDSPLRPRRRNRWTAGTVPYDPDAGTGGEDGTCNITHPGCGGNWSLFSHHYRHSEMAAKTINSGFSNHHPSQSRKRTAGPVPCEFLRTVTEVTPCLVKNEAVPSVAKSLKPSAVKCCAGFTPEFLSLSASEINTVPVFGSGPKELI